MRSFDRVQLLEEKGETSAGVSIGDLNGDGLSDIVLGKGRHWPLFNRRRLGGAARISLFQRRGWPLSRSPMERRQGHLYGMAFADFDGDKWPEIVAARTDAPNAIWFSTKPQHSR